MPSARVTLDVLSSVFMVSSSAIASPGCATAGFDRSRNMALGFSLEILAYRGRKDVGTSARERSGPHANSWGEGLTCQAAAMTDPATENARPPRAQAPMARCQAEIRRGG